MKGNIDVGHASAIDLCAIIILAPTGITYTAQTNGLGCNHPTAEGFVINGCRVEDVPDVCDYGCTWFGEAEEEHKIKFTDIFDSANLRFGENCTIKFDRDRMSECEEGWIPIIVNGIFDSFNKLVFENEKGFIHSGNCD